MNLFNIPFQCCSIRSIKRWAYTFIFYYSEFRIINAGVCRVRDQIIFNQKGKRIHKSIDSGVTPNAKLKIAAIPLLQIINIVEFS